MVQTLSRLHTFARRRRGIALLYLLPVVLVVGARWMVSAPLDAAGSPPMWSAEEAEVEPDRLADAPVDWPDGRLEGKPAGHLLRRATADLADRLEAIGGYEAIVRRHERVNGHWLPEQTLRMKVRHRPASVYMKDIGVEHGCEIIHVEGLRGGKLLSHPGGGLIGLLIPPVELDPHSPLAMSQSRFPITDAGVLPVARRLRDAADRDADDPGASVVLDRVVEDGRTYYRSVQRYDAPSDDRPFARVEVRYEPETLLLHSYAFFEWPESPVDEPPLAGRYVIESFDPEVALGDLDFDPTNPSYDFR